MRTCKPGRRRGFTLVELLTVIAIIALLIGILVPALSKVREQAKRVSTQNLHSVLGKACEMFHADLGRYPRSHGDNPFETTSVPLSGAQWLALQLAGADLRGFVKYKPDEDYDSDGDGVGPEDWQFWYSDEDGSEDLRRWGPYFEVGGDLVRTPTTFVSNLADLPAALTAGDSSWPNSRLAFIVDAFGFPVLYYAANPRVRSPFTVWDSADTVGVAGRYDQRDNEAFTGSDFVEGALDLGDGSDHPLAILGWDVDQTERPPEDSFAGRVYDQGLFDQTETTAGGRIWPHRPETFFFLSPGPGGRYGTTDDVTSF